MVKKAERKKNRALEAAGFDLWLLAPVVILCGVGLLMVMSASSVLAEVRYDDTYHLFKKQALSLGLGLTVMVACLFIKTSLLRSQVYPLLLVSLTLLILVFVPGLGRSAGGATSWLRVAGFSLQPSEVAKLSLCLYLAYSMAKNRGNMDRFSVGLLPHLIIGGGMVALTVLQRDLGMSAILFILLLVTLFLGGARIKQLTGLALAVGAAGVFLILVAPYRIQRIAAYTDPWADPKGTGFQIIHSFLAFGTGGLFGAGLGHSHQRLGYLPEPHTDFIFAILGEEIGFVGVVAVVGLFLLLAYRGFHWAAKAQEPFQRYLALGMTLIITVQALVNMMVVLGLMPTTGVTLPFISYGGTSLVVNLAAAGVLMRLSLEIRRG